MASIALWILLDSTYQRWNNLIQDQREDRSKRSSAIEINCWPVKSFDHHLQVCRIYRASFPIYSWIMGSTRSNFQPSRLASGLRLIFVSRMVPLNKTESCKTIPYIFAGYLSRLDISSIKFDTAPSIVKTLIRFTVCSACFPDPVGPTTAIILLLLALRWKHLSSDTFDRNPHALSRRLLNSVKAGAFCRHFTQASNISWIDPHQWNGCGALLTAQLVIELEIL